MTHQPVCLTIAGLDPSGGAGIIADIKTFSAFGCFASAAIASITFQNTTGVFGAEHQTAESVRQQVEPIIRDYDIAALKTGMLPTQEVIEEVARLKCQMPNARFVVDPVVRSTSGYDLIDNAALQSLIEVLFPLSDLITPNRPEAERISGIAIESTDDIAAAASVMREMGARNVLIKGGHLAGGAEGDRKAMDHLFIDGEVYIFEEDYVDTMATHGTGCSLAAAIAANLAQGKDMNDAVRVAKEFVTKAIRTAPVLGHGHSPINLLVNCE